MRDSRSVIDGSGPIQALVVDPHWNATHRWNKVLWGIPALGRAYCVRTLPEGRHWLSSRLGINLLVVEEGIIGFYPNSREPAVLPRFLSAATRAGIPRIALVLPGPPATSLLPEQLDINIDYVYPGDVLSAIPRLVASMAV